MEESQSATSLADIWVWNGVCPKHDICSNSKRSGNWSGKYGDICSERSDDYAKTTYSATFINGRQALLEDRIGDPNDGHAFPFLII